MTDLVRCRSLSLLALLSVTSGCSSLGNCSEERTDVIHLDVGRSDPDKLRYESAPWGGSFAPFPAKSKVSFEHHLGVTPFFVKAYLAFTKDGTKDAEAGSISEVAGNEGLYDCIDSNVIVLRNDTCEESFFVKVVAADEALYDRGDSCALTKKP